MLKRVISEIGSARGVRRDSPGFAFRAFSGGERPGCGVLDEPHGVAGTEVPARLRPGHSVDSTVGLRVGHQSEERLDPTEDCFGETSNEGEGVGDEVDADRQGLDGNLVEDEEEHADAEEVGECEAPPDVPGIQVIQIQPEEPEVELTSAGVRGTASAVVCVVFLDDHGTPLSVGPHALSFLLLPASITGVEGIGFVFVHEARGEACYWWHCVCVV